MNDDEFREMQRKKATKHGYYSAEKRWTSELVRNTWNSPIYWHMLCPEWQACWKVMTDQVIEVIGLLPSRDHRLLLVPPADKATVRWVVKHEVPRGCLCDFRAQVDCAESASRCAWREWRTVSDLLGDHLSDVRADDL